jgi:hypothetical protein
LFVKTGETGELEQSLIEFEGEEMQVGLASLRSGQIDLGL